MRYSRNPISLLWILTLLVLALVLLRAIDTAGKASGRVAHLDQERIESITLKPPVTVRAAGRGNPYINLVDGRDLLSTYFGEASAVQLLQQGRAYPTSLTSADFDEDGVPDLVSGYAGPRGGLLAVYRGNVDSIFPNAPDAKKRKAEGSFVDAPFFPSAKVFGGPEAADFLEAGDFDCDGHWDVVTAAHGSAVLYLFSGNGRGDLKLTKSIQVSGTVTTMVAGEVNRRDGLTDLAVGILGPKEPQVVVFESPSGALLGEPEVFSAPAAVVGLAMGQLDDDYPMDLAVGAGSEIFIIHGRDRKLSLDDAERGKVPSAEITRHSFNSKIASLAAGNFTNQRQTEIAVLFDDGKVQVVGERSGPGKKARTLTLLVSDEWSKSSHLVRAKVSSLPHDDLLLVDPGNHQIHILGGEKEKESTETVALSLDLDDEPIAVLTMQLNVDALQDLVVLKRGENNLTTAMTAPMSTFVVNSAGDGSDCDVNDGVCSLGTVVQGQCVLTNECTLRAAIQQANASAGLDAISFAIGAGRQTITPSLSEPFLTSPAVVDGTSQPGFSGSPIIELNGASAGSAHGLGINAGSSMVRGMVINRFTAGGILLQTNGGNVIVSNYIGTDVTGTVGLGGAGDGVDITLNSNNVVGGTTSGARNIVSGNGYGGIYLDRSSGNSIMGNFVGTDVTGKIALNNGAQVNSAIAGILIGYSDDVPNTNNTIGGTTAGARNIVSGNTAGPTGSGVGVAINLKNVGNMIQGNYIGTSVDGTVALPNSLGVQVESSADNNTIGGTTPAARNLISGSSHPIFGRGVTIVSKQTVVSGNYIGTDVTGTIQISNALDGVYIPFGSNNIIGGNTAGARNIISGNNGNGVQIFNAAATGNQILGNFIGTKADGISPLANNGHGVFITNLASSNTIGGVSAGSGNIIQNNGGDGVYLDSGARNAIVGNAIFGNAGLGIDLGANGVNGNDSGDVDSGANNLQNFPVLTSVSSVGSNTIIHGTLNSTPNTTFLLSFYANSQCDPSGFGEGQTFIGSASVTTDSAGNATLNLALPVGLHNAQLVTATATDGSNNTSEFSACRIVVGQQFNLKVDFKGTGSGLVTSSPAGIFCNGGLTNCEHSFDGSVSLQAFPSGTSIFLHWDKDCTGTNPTCVIEMDRAKQVDAYFVDVGFDELSHFQRAVETFRYSIAWQLIQRNGLPLKSVSSRKEVGADRRLKVLSTLPTAAVANVKIELSRNGGANFETLIASTPNDGSECWLVTGPTTTQALIRISSTDNPSITGVSAHPFEIANSPLVGTLPPVDPGPGYCADLSAGDGRSQIRGGSFFADRYTFSGSVGQQVAIALTSPSLDTYLYLLGPDGSIIAQDNNGGGGTDSRIPATSGFFTLPATGAYAIEATSFAANSLGGYQLKLDSGPLLLTAQNGERATALDSVTMIREPFPLVSVFNFSADHRTRLSLFAVNAQLLFGEDSSVLTAQAEDSQNRIYPLTVEYVGSVPNFGWLTQINVRLPDQLANAGDVWVSTSLRGVVGNRALVNIK